MGPYLHHTLAQLAPSLLWSHIAACVYQHTGMRAHCMHATPHAHDTACHGTPAHQYTEMHGTDKAHLMLVLATRREGLH